MLENDILSCGTARVSGRTTGLAGCLDGASCPRGEPCLRADERLTAVRIHHAEGGACFFHIPVARKPE